MKTRNQYIVPFGGLKEGVHLFDFEAEEKFFEEYDTLEVSNGHLDIHIDMVKESSLLTFKITIKGKVYVQCDRCLDFYYQDIGFEGKLFIKFSERTETNNAPDDVIFLHPGDNEIDLKHYIYESISISMPYKKIHPDINGVSTCNKEMITQLNKHHGKSGMKNENHTWDKLKDLLGTNNNI